MSILSWFLKPKIEMAKPNTKHVKIGKYTITSHAQNRTVEKARSLKKSDMVNNLFTKPHAITTVKEDKNGLSYDRVGKTATTSIDPTNNHVCSIRRPSKKEAKKYNLEKRGRKYVKKKKTKNNRRKKS